MTRKAPAPDALPPAPAPAEPGSAPRAPADQLRLATVGSVDDGKSTLIGRLLFDSRRIHEDHLEALERDSRTQGSAGEGLDLALLLDGLEAEREQGITIDVAHRFFSTPRRRFLLADCPGHVQYTRNMITGASGVDLAILLVDVRAGVLEQTRRHAFLVSLLGIRHLVVAVNKMDLVDFRAAPFEQVREDFSAFAARLEIPDVHFLPVSALEGDNVVTGSPRTPWYRGPSLLTHLETVHIASDRNLIDLRFPVQQVLRERGDFRGYRGSVASGVLRVGDPVLALPSGARSRIRRIVTFDGDLAEATPPRAVTVTLEDELDLARGDLLVPPRNQPRQTREVEVMLAWMGDRPLEPGRTYTVQLGHQRVPGSVADLRYRVGLESLRREDAESLEANQIGRARLVTRRPLLWDPYSRNRSTGALILIAPESHQTLAAGMVLDRLSEEDTAPSGTRGKPPELGSEGVPPHPRPSFGADLEGQVLWVLPGEDASRGSEEALLDLVRGLRARGLAPVILDPPTLLAGIAEDLGEGPGERGALLRRAAHLARLLATHGLLPVLALPRVEPDPGNVLREILGAPPLTWDPASELPAAWLRRTFPGNAPSE